jgi:hypothetical protein
MIRWLLRNLPWRRNWSVRSDNGKMIARRGSIEIYD